MGIHPGTTTLCGRGKSRQVNMQAILQPDVRISAPGHRSRFGINQGLRVALPPLASVSWIEFHASEWCPENVFRDFVLTQKQRDEYGSSWRRRIHDHAHSWTFFGYSLSTVRTPNSRIAGACFRSPGGLPRAGRVEGKTTATCYRIRYSRECRAR